MLRKCYYLLCMWALALGPYARGAGGGSPPLGLLNFFPHLYVTKIIKYVKELKSISESIRIPGYGGSPPLSPLVYICILCICRCTCTLGNVGHMYSCMGNVAWAFTPVLSEPLADHLIGPDIFLSPSILYNVGRGN